MRLFLIQYFGGMEDDNRAGVFLSFGLKSLTINIQGWARGTSYGDR